MVYYIILSGRGCLLEIRDDGNTYLFEQFPISCGAFLFKNQGQREDLTPTKDLHRTHFSSENEVAISRGNRLGSSISFMGIQTSCITSIYIYIHIYMCV